MPRQEFDEQVLSFEDDASPDAVSDSLLNRSLCSPLTCGPLGGTVNDAN